LADTTQKWEQDWKAFCDSCQDMEELRMEFMKDNMWAYANAVSTVCVSDDEVSMINILCIGLTQPVPVMRENSSGSRTNGAREGYGEFRP
jgi:hypothetical protein